MVVWLRHILGKNLRSGIPLHLTEFAFKKYFRACSGTNWGKSFVCFWLRNFELNLPDNEFLTLFLATFFGLGFGGWRKWRWRSRRCCFLLNKSDGFIKVLVWVLYIRWHVYVDGESFWKLRIRFRNIYFFFFMDRV